MYFKVNLIILLFRVVFGTAFVQRYLGDLCSIASGKKGICKLISLCPSALHGIETQNSFPEHCGFLNFEPIVCCVNDSTLGMVDGDHYARIPKPTTKKIQTTISTSTQRIILKVGDRSKQKCQEYEKYVQQTEDCGAFKSENETYAKPKEFPHMALIGFEVENEAIHWGCSGSLISEKFVLSAAHCIYNKENLTAKYILLGTTHLDKDDSESQLILIKSISRHPNYNPHSLYHDLSLFELERNAIINSYTRPACLNTNPSLQKARAIATGWGRDSVYVDDNKKMYSLTLESFATTQCNLNIFNGFSQGLFEQTQLCAGIRSGFEKICQGDSGGPLQILNPLECMYKIIGVTSIGKSCGPTTNPGVYTKVSAYINWIENIVWP